MLKVILESYDWLLKIDNLSDKYIQKYIENYLENIFNIEISLDNDQMQYDIKSADIFGEILDTLDKTDIYKISKIINDEDTFINKVYDSINCKYEHSISIIGDLTKYEYILQVIISDTFNNYLTDDDIIELYNNDDEILLSLIDNIKGGVKESYE